MHELSLADAIVSALLKKSQEEEWGKVSAIHLRIGALRQVFPDILSFAFETVARDTPLAGASLVIEEIPLEWRCLDCDSRWSEVSPLVEPPEDTSGTKLRRQAPRFISTGDSGVCPACGSLKREALAGMELDIHTVEVEES